VTDLVRFGVIVGATKAYDFERGRRAARRAAARLRASLAEAELELLHLRLQPHLPVQRAAGDLGTGARRSRAGRRAIVAMGELLRRGLAGAGRPVVPLARTGGTRCLRPTSSGCAARSRSTSQSRCRARRSALGVPNFALQPLVENALRHGLRGRERGRVSVRAWVEDEMLTIEIADDGAGPRDGARARTRPLERPRAARPPEWRHRDGTASGRRDDRAHVASGPCGRVARDAGDGMTLRVAIVEDEPLPRRRLRRMLEAQDARVVGGVREPRRGGRLAVRASRGARTRCSSTSELGDGSGFDVIDALPAGDAPPVVFVTAYDQFAVRAFEVRAVDYLLKPFEGAARPARARARARPDRASAQRDELEVLRDLVAELRAQADAMRGGGPEKLARIPVRARGETVLVPVDVDRLDRLGRQLTSSSIAATRCTSYGGRWPRSRNGSIPRASCASIAGRSSTSSASGPAGTTRPATSRWS
jgi:CheY-like chemotaxis protein